MFKIGDHIRNRNNHSTVGVISGIIGTTLYIILDSGTGTGSMDVSVAEYVPAEGSSVQTDIVMFGTLIFCAYVLAKVIFSGELK